MCERAFTYNVSMTKDPVAALKNFFNARRRMPTYSEIASMMGYKSKNAVFRLVGRLEAAGLIEKDKTGHIVPSRLFTETRLLGAVQAGFPSPAEEELSDTVSIDDYLIKNKEATYLLMVKGDSMIDAGIREGDLVVAERAVEPHFGDIVIALVDGEWTMKYYRKKEGRVVLVPANKKYRDIVPTSDLRIEAVVRGVIRKYT